MAIKAVNNLSTVTGAAVILPRDEGTSVGGQFFKDPKSGNVSVHFDSTPEGLVVLVLQDGHNSRYPGCFKGDIFESHAFPGHERITVPPAPAPAVSDEQKREAEAKADAEAKVAAESQAAEEKAAADAKAKAAADAKAKADTDAKAAADKAAADAKAKADADAKAKADADAKANQKPATK